MSPSRRIQKVSSLLKKEISLILNNELEDQLISENFITISKIDISSDLHYCKIHISCSLQEEKKIILVKNLNNLKSVIKHKLCQRIEMRRIPELVFKIDKELEKGISVLKILDELREKEGKT